MRTLNAILISFLGFSFVTIPNISIQTHAQDTEMFKDVPTVNWAYDDVKRLRSDGLLKGYPGAIFIGQRPMTRYEFAAATRAAYEAILLKIGQGGTSGTGDLQNRLAALEAKVASQQGDIDQNKADIAAIKQQLADRASLKDDIARINRLADAFEKELANLGVDVQNLQADSKKMRAQLDELLKRPVPINIQGDLFLGMRAGYSINNKIGIDLNAGNFGAFAAPGGVGFIPGSLSQDLHAVQELGIDFNGEFGNNVRGTASVIIGNYLTYLQNGLLGGTPRGGAAASVLVGDIRDEKGSADVALYRAGVNFTIPALGGIDVLFGRIGYQVSPYTYSRIDPDFYFDIPRYDDGNVYFDGAKLGFGYGKTVKLDIFGGKNNNISAANLMNFQEIEAGNFFNTGTWFPNTLTGGGRPNGLVQGSMPISTSAGANLKFDISRMGSVGGTFILLDGPLTPSGFTAEQFNRVAVMGANTAWKLGSSVKVNGEYAQSQLLYNNDSRLSRENWAAHGEVTFAVNDNLHLAAGYKEIRPYFAAPGAWGRIGFWYNPTDIRGFTGGFAWKGTSKLSISASGEFYEGTNRRLDPAGNLAGFSSSDKITRILANITYAVCPRFDLFFDYEGVFWDLKNRPTFDLDIGPFKGGKPMENYYTLGFGYELGSDARLKFAYQIVDYNAAGVGNWFAPSSSSSLFNNGNARGGLITTQLSVKF